MSNSIYNKRQAAADSIMILKEQLVKQEEFSSSFNMQLAPLGFSNCEFVDKIKVKIEELKVGE